MSTFKERLAAANQNNTETASHGIDTSRPLLPEGVYMAKLSNIGGFKKDTALGWGRSTKAGANLGKLYAQANITWALNSKTATTLLNQENPLVFSENSIFLTLYDENSTDGIGVNFFKSNSLVDLLGAALFGDGSSKNGTAWVFEDWVLEGLNGINETISETFEFNPELKETTKTGEVLVPEDIQVAIAQMTALNKLLESWNIKANVFVIQQTVMKDGKATDQKRNAVRNVQAWEQLDD